MPDNDFLRRDVTKQNISNSFRGILRISPDDVKGDIGFDAIPTTSTVTDSIGNPTPLELGSDLVNTHSFKADGKTDITDEFNIIGNENNQDFYQYIDSKGNKTKVSLTKPSVNEILISDRDGNYTRQNLWEIIASELRKFNIFNSIVPVSTVFYTAMKSLDINNLPEQYREDYMICDGSLLPKADYPELYKCLGNTWGGNGNKFRIPNLLNKFIRGASDIPSGANVIMEDGDFEIPAHLPGTEEYPQTNMYPVKFGINDWYCEFNTTARAESGPEVNPTGSMYQIAFAGYGGTGSEDNANWRVYRYRIDFSRILNKTKFEPKETHPYNAALVPIIKVKNSNVPNY